MTQRVYNFSAGPAVLPESVLQKAASELLNYQGSGQSVMEMSHRSSVYEGIQAKVEKDLRDLLAIPSHYKVLFLQGGASQQFAMIPMNLLKTKAQYVLTGNWAKKAYEEAGKFGKVEAIASSEGDNYTHIPDLDQAMVDPKSDYLYYVSNNTIYGTRMNVCPPLEHACVIADMSSDILSRPIDVSKHGIIFAGAQKNMGIAGLTVVIIRDDLLDKGSTDLPTMLQFKIHADNQSLYNTPPAYAIYMAGLVLEWVKDLGGLKAMEVLNRKKADYLYDYIDSTPFYRGTAKKEDRSWMNVTFKTPSEELDKALINLCTQRGLVNLKGYRTVGGLRASIYNAMPFDGVKALVEIMKEFEKANA